jgi:hypothetical protein
MVLNVKFIMICLSILNLLFEVPCIFCIVNSFHASMNVNLCSLLSLFSPIMDYVTNLGALAFTMNSFTSNNS